MGSLFRQVRGCLFNAAPEMAFANSIYGEIQGGVVGMGFEPLSLDLVNSLTPYFDNDAPYIVYLGRKETGKNVQVLIDWFCEAKSSGLIRDDLRLVIAGGGSFDDLHRPAAKKREDITDLIHLSEIEKKRVIKHSLFLAQPSTNESFSIVIMEAWQLGVPVVVHANCAVTKHHVIESVGGLYASSFKDFGGVTTKLLNDKELRDTLASNGARYVAEQYSWQAVTDRFDEVLSRCIEIRNDRTELNS